MFGILLCAFFLPLVFGLLSFPVPLPLSHRESPQTGNFIRQQIGEKKKNYLFFFWVVTKRTSLAGDGGTEGGGRSAVTAYRGCMWGQTGPKEEGGDGEQSGPYLPQHRGALGHTGLFRQKHILTCRPPTQKREQSDFRGPAEYSKEDQITLNSGKWRWCLVSLLEIECCQQKQQRMNRLNHVKSSLSWCIMRMRFFCLHWENASLLSNVF